MDAVWTATWTRHVGAQCTQLWSRWWYTMAGPKTSAAHVRTAGVADWEDWESAQVRRLGGGERTPSREKILAPMPVVPAP